MRNIHKIDASGKILGRLASGIAVLLRGKQKPEFLPYKDDGDKVVVYNTDKIRVTGKKEEKKIYYRHSGYLGGLTATLYKDLFKKDSREVLKKAVYGMLPKNKLRAKMIKRLEMHKGELS